MYIQSCPQSPGPRTLEERDPSTCLWAPVVDIITMDEHVIERWKNGMHHENMEKKAKPSSLSSVERGGTGDLTVVRNRRVWGACTTTWGHGDVQAQAATGGHVWGQWPYHSWALFWCLGPVLSLKAIWMWVVWAAAWDHIDVSEIYWWWKGADWSVWPVLWLRAHLNL